MIVRQQQNRDIPSGLRRVAETAGLSFPTRHIDGLITYPIQGRGVPTLKVEELSRLPVQMNFHVVMLDMDNEDDRSEYETTMDYMASGYGMKILHLERILVVKTKKRKDGTTVKRKVRRVYLEYYAPYRIVPPNLNRT